MARKKFVKTYEYTCTLTGAKFTTTREAPNPSELVSVKGYYELHPEDDDRPEVIKRQLEFEDNQDIGLTMAEENSEDKAE